MQVDGRDKSAKLNLVLAAVVAVAAVYSIGWYIYSPLTRPSIDDYNQFSRYIHANWTRGDVLAVTPFWAERVREYAGDLKVINPPNLVDEDLGAYRRLWLLSVFNYANKRDLLGTLSHKYKLAGEQRFGRLGLYLFEMAQSGRVTYDFREQIQKAHVYVDKDGQRKECATFRDGGWRCPGNSWEYVGQETLDVDDNPRACLWSHPTTGGSVNTEFKGVPLGRRIVVHSGLTRNATRMKEGAPVTLEVLVDGRSVLTAVNRNAPGWNIFEADTSAMAGGNHDVLFRVTTPQDGMRHYCFTADSRE
jgi:hypothetical protein